VARPGIGKTSLVEQFAESVRRGPSTPAAFLVGRCDDLLTNDPPPVEMGRSDWLLAEGTAVDAVALAHITGGNPFFVTEILGAPGGEVPATVRDAVLGRLAALSDAARTAVMALSVVPSRCERWLAEALTGAAPGAMAEAERTGVLQGTARPSGSATSWPDARSKGRSRRRNGCTSTGPCSAG
jgi:hypothetical protein